MKLLPVQIMIGAAFFFALSCAAVDYAKMYPNMVANADPFSVGTIEAQLDRSFSSKMNRVEINVIFYPRLNSVALEFRYELITHRQFWDENGRKQFAAALELYKADYEERKLINKPRKTRAVYGKTRGRSEWETFRLAKTRITFPVINLGYRFKNDMPFFTTIMLSAVEYGDSADNTTREESPQVSIYFTRAQADALVQLFDQKYLMTSLENYDGSESGESSKGFLGIDWSSLKRKGKSKSKQPVVGDVY